jgi:putative transposase
MLELTDLLGVLAPALETNVRTLIEMVKGIYCISSGGVTMKNISRWTGQYGSYRSIQRLMAQSINWLALNLLLFQSAYLDAEPVGRGRFFLALDETVEDKSRDSTFGIGWFYSSIAGKVIRSVSNHVISMVDAEKENSYVLTHRPTVKAQTKTGANNKKRKKGKGKKKKGTDQPKKKAGRPKGSKNKQNVKKEGLLYESFEALLGTVVPLLAALVLGIRHVVGDGAYGNQTCCLIAKQFDLELISKLNRNTALYLPYEGPYSGRGRPRKYGPKLDYDNLPKEYLVHSLVAEGILTQIYQLKKVWTKHMPCLINVVVIIKTDLETSKKARVVLFSTDLALESQTLIKFYSLRFQIEFNFRDAKQFFGLSDFKNVKEQQVNNAVGLALFMDNVSLILIQRAKEVWQEEKVSIQDLKSYFRAEKYLADILNTLEIAPEPFLKHRQFADIFKIGAVNRTKTGSKAA